MTQVFILQNQDKLFLNKKNEWSDGRDLGSLFKTAHKDEAVNQVFEVSSKDYHQRIQMVSCPLNEKGLPDIDPEIMPPPLPKEESSEQLSLEGVSNENPEASTTLSTVNETTDQAEANAELQPESNDIAVNQA